MIQPENPPEVHSALDGGTSGISRWWASVIGFGLALSPIHNVWLTNLATNSKGETLFFLPAIGYLLTIMGAGMFLVHHWKDVRYAGWGEKRVYVPLLIIVGAVGLSGLTSSDINGKIAPLGMVLSLGTLYLASRVLGDRLFTPLAFTTVAASLGVIAYKVLHPADVTGGFVFEGNYDILAGYVLLGTILYHGRYRKPVFVLGVIALLLSGSPEALFSLAALGLAVIIRRDWSWRTVDILAPLLIVVIAFFASGYGVKTYSYATHILRTENPAELEATPATEDGTRKAVGYRLWVVQNEMSRIQPLGTGYSLTDFRDRLLPSGETTRIIHNVPLVIVQQLGWPGVLAGLAWLWVSLYCLVRTRWKYAWVLVLSLSVFDHFTWTQLAPWWWAVAGASATSLRSDALYKEMP